jgi:hypothetical protein
MNAHNIEHKKSVEHEVQYLCRAIAGHAGFYRLVLSAFSQGSFSSIPTRPLDQPRITDSRVKNARLLIITFL